MNNDFKQLIDNWKNEKNIFENKNVWKLNATIKQNEYLLLFEINATFKFNRQTETVKISKLFQTLAQNDNALRYEGDIYRLKSLFTQLESDFTLKLEEAINKHIKDISALDKQEI
ncbi:MAG: hypothetical protein K9N34_10830 [Candidatus Marinimicrobia bacterium]|nr:hypothetical protein [Candidatus Neomarinimicrobiota bacterium]